MTNRLVPYLMVALGAVNSAELAAQDKLSDVAALLDQMEMAEASRHGGVPKSLMIEGTCEFTLKTMPGEGPTKGSYGEYYDGDKSLHTSDFKRFGKMIEGVNGDIVWQLDPLTGASILDGEARESKLRQFGLSRGEPWRKYYTSAECVGIEEIEGTSCHSVDLATESGELETWYIGRDDKLVHGMDLRAFTPNGKEDIELRFSDWQLAGGRQHAKTMTVETRFVYIVYSADRIDTESHIPASLFDLPESIQQQLDDDQPDDETAVKIIEVAEQQVASIRAKVKISEIGQTLGVILPEVMGYVTESDAGIAGPPFSRYHSFGAATVDLEAGIPVANPIEGTDRIKSRTLPGGKVAMTWHIGDYHRIPKAYKRIEKWMKKNKIEDGGARWEVYWTDPGREPDPKKWRTQVFWKVK